MSSDYSTSLKYDQRLSDIDDKIQYTVIKGSSDNTYQTENSNTATSSSLNFSINPPSESTCIDRHMLLRATLRLRFNITKVVATQYAWQYGTRESFQSFPLNRLFTTVTASLNNVSTSLNQSQCMSALLRMIPQEYLQKYNGMTPTMLDNYGNLPDAFDSNSNPMGSYQNASHNQYLLPRGCHRISYDNWNVLHNINGGGTDSSLLSTHADDSWVIDADVTFTEPWLLSPFMFNAYKANKSAFLGINNLSFVISVDGTLSRLWSTANPAAILAPANFVISARPGGNGLFQNAEMLVNYMTAPVSLVLPAKSVLPFNSFTAYPTTGTSIPARVARSAVTGAGGSMSSVIQNINSIQLEVVPDLLIFMARSKSSGAFTQLDADVFLPIVSASITFGNKSGLLSGCSPQHLWLMSQKNKSCIDWVGFQGLVSQSTSVDPIVNEVATCGSLLVISPTLDLGIQSPYAAAGSVGQWNLSCQLGVANNTLGALAPEVVVLAMRSGVIVTASGQSTLTTNMLNASIVTSAIENAAKAKSGDYERMVGGGARSGGAYSGGISSKLSALSM